MDRSLCLADLFCFETPTSVEKQILFKDGLGLKKIKIDLEDDANAVKGTRRISRPPNMWQFLVNAEQSEL